MLNISEIITDRLRIVPFSPSFENARKFFEFVKNNREYFYFMYGFVEAQTVEDIYDFLVRRNMFPEYLLGLYPKDVNEAVGFVNISGYNDKNKKVALGYFMDQNFSSRGYMSEAVIAVSNELFYKGCRKIQMTVDIGNIASQKVCEKSGFVKEARLVKEKYNRHTQGFDDVFVYYKLNPQIAVDSD